jgi:3-isopropylmalate/(R)-2-methylmalate dehydratase small subunit
MLVQGRAWRLGDNVDTDQLLPGRYLTLTDPAALAAHCLEDLVPRFSELARPGDIVVAGDNFGCGSSREHAPTALKALGISCLLASSYARIFFRNCINLGLPALTSHEAVSGIQDGDEIRVDLETGEIENLTRPFRASAPPLSAYLVEIIEAGGLTTYVRRQLAAETSLPGDG